MKLLLQQHINVAKFFLIICLISFNKIYVRGQYQRMLIQGDILIKKSTDSQLVQGKCIDENLLPPPVNLPYDKIYSDPDIVFTDNGEVRKLSEFLG